MSGLILPDSAPGLVLDAVRSKAIEPVVSWELAEEIVRVLRRPRLRRYAISDEDVDDVVKLLGPFLPSIEIDVQVPIRDPTDAPAFMAALAGRAEAIITGDRDFLDAPELIDWLLDRGVQVMTPAEALARLG